jgi:putative endonuclease
MTETFFVYIMTNAHHTVLYLGMTNDLLRRVSEHRSGQVPGFTKRYNVTKLVYFEELGSAWDAIAREKQLKGGSRRKKIELIERLNPEWRDLYEGLVLVP